MPMVFIGNDVGIDVIVPTQQQVLKAFNLHYTPFNARYPFMNGDIIWPLYVEWHPARSIGWNIGFSFDDFEYNSPAKEVFHSVLQFPKHLSIDEHPKFSARDTRVYTLPELIQTGEFSWAVGFISNELVELRL